MSGKAQLTGAFGERVKKYLREITALLENNKIDYCLDSGTLLGIVREGRLLPWDDDLDLFVPSADAPKLERLKWRLRIRGFKVAVTRVNEDYGPLKKGSMRIFKIRTRSWLFRPSDKKLLVDIIVKYPEDGYYYWSVGVNDVVNKRVARHFYDSMGSIKFDGKTYPIPGDVENYLTERYGEWRTPVKEWDFKKDDCARVTTETL